MLPSVLKFNPDVDEVIVMVPVDTVQEGCVTEIVGADGVEGCVFTVATVAFDTHPDAFRAVTLYDPVAMPLNIPVVLV